MKHLSNYENRPFSIIVRDKFREWLRSNPGKLSPAARLVMLSLCEYANNRTGLAWPSASTLSEDNDLTRSSVFNALRQLEEYSLIRRKNRKENTNQYRFFPDDHDISRLYLESLVDRGG